MCLIFFKDFKLSEWICVFLGLEMILKVSLGEFCLGVIINFIVIYVFINIVIYVFINIGKFNWVIVEVFGVEFFLR